MTAAIDPLAAPLTIGGRQLRNRVVMTPHLARIGPVRLPSYIARRAEGGIAMAILPAGLGIISTPVAYPPEITAELDTAAGVGEPDGIAYHPRDERHATKLLPTGHEFLAGLARAVQQHGVLAIGQIHHPGAEQSWDNFQPLVAPSAIRGDEFGAVPHALTITEIGDLIHGYVGTSAAIVAAGMDGVELHASHGYLLNRFLSPYYNTRTDEFGAGDALLRRLLEAIRERVGDNVLLGVRMQVNEEIPGGLEPAQVAKIAIAIAPYVDYLSLSIGNHIGLRDSRPTTAYTSSWLVGPPPAVAGARLIRDELVAAGVARPTLVTGRITTAAAARSILDDGVADMVGMARALVADPDFVNKAISGQDRKIIECIGCNECVRVPLSCTVNPAAGREKQLDIGRPIRDVRRVVVVGAGPAGVSAAATAAERGHRVVLVDAATAVGGALRAIVKAPLLAEWSPLLTQLEDRVDASGVDHRPDTVATPEVLAGLDPQVVVWATGSAAAPAGFPTDAPALSTLDLLAGARPAAGVPVVVVGGAEIHTEPFIAADLLSAEGWPVVLLSERRDPGSDIEPRTLTALLSRLLRRGVLLYSMTRPVQWAEGMLRAENIYGGLGTSFSAGAVVLAHGRVAAPAAPAGPAPTYVIGDALAPRRLTHAILEGTRFGSAL